MDKDKIINDLKAQIARLERKDRLKTYVYPHNAFISDDVVMFCYDSNQRKALGKEDKMVFDIKSLELYKYKAFLRANAKDLGLYSWNCGEGGEGYYSNVIDRELYNQCFTIRLSECLHRMIELDNDLKLSLLKTESFYYEKNR